MQRPFPLTVFALAPNTSTLSAGIVDRELGQRVEEPSDDLSVVDTIFFSLESRSSVFLLMRQRQRKHLENLRAREEEKVYVCLLHTTLQLETVKWIFRRN